MITTYEEIIRNIPKNGDFSASSVTAKLASEIAEALLKNSSIIQLDFTGSEIFDKEFQVIAKALIARNQKGLTLIVDNTKITLSSISILKSLIDNEIVKTLLMFGIKGVNTRTTEGIDLAKYAENNLVNISYDSPRKRTSLGFFDNIMDQDKDPSPFNVKEQEIKKLNDSSQQNNFKNR